MDRSKKAEDFHVGQEVICVRPEEFVSSVASYLRNRTGIVKQVLPSNGEWPMRKNAVRVLWQKRNGRGKEKSMLMHPYDIAPTAASSGDQ